MVIKKIIELRINRWRNEIICFINLDEEDSVVNRSTILQIVPGDIVDNGSSVKEIIGIIPDGLIVHFIVVLNKIFKL